MGLNLHSVVRGAVQVVNPDVRAIYLASRGYVQDAVGKQQPIYSPPYWLSLQLQPPTTRDLQHINYLNLQGVIRVVYLYSNPQAVNRVLARGGDLIMVPQWQPHVTVDDTGAIVTDNNTQPVLGAAPFDNWLVTAVDEWYDIDGLGWSKLYVTLQTDGPFIVIDNNRLPVLDSNGGLVHSQ